MPVSHSHQLLCVSFRSQLGARDQHRASPDRSTSQISWPWPPNDAQQIDRVGVALRQRLAVADARHLRAAVLVVALLARDVREVFRLRRIGDVDDRGAVELGLAGQRIDRLRHLRRAAVVADIGDVAVALLVDGRLIGAARLQVVVADQAHVLRLGRIADLLLLRQRRRRRDQQQRNHARCPDHSSSSSPRIVVGRPVPFGPQSSPSAAPRHRGCGTLATRWPAKG